MYTKDRKFIIVTSALQLTKNAVLRIAMGTTKDHFDHKAHINRRAQRHSKHKSEQKHKRSTKEVPPWNGQ